ncbi:Crp/Fnr family transcriptional regulator [Sphingomonas sp.]|uniref:Crp/Fnr family transcriptional regulator n=1 Tax=Sphingomonas sp. TaxID=28214 RepID=UPI002DED0DF6|nr:Crp/Fnr family transcriptional regulator [Sphingomonas sp.]
MNAEDLSRMMPSNALISSWGAAELQDLLERAQLCPMKKGDVLLHQGDAGDYLIILLDGTIRVSMVASNGREIILDYLEPGAVIGEIALLDGGERTASATALGEGKYLKLGAKAFREVLEKHPSVAWRLLREMARRLRNANNTIESDRAYASGPRLARTLQRLMQTGAQGAALRLDLSQSELGAFAGISRENINRQLGAWADAGIVSLESGRVRVLDRDVLEEIAMAAE